MNVADESSLSLNQFYSNCGPSIKKMRNDDTSNEFQGQYNVENISNVMKMSPSPFPNENSRHELRAANSAAEYIPREVQGREKRARFTQLSDVGIDGEERSPTHSSAYTQDVQLLLNTLQQTKEQLSNAMQQSAQKDQEIDRLGKQVLILKKGINIQSARNSDFQTQHEQYQQVLQCASQHIAGLERVIGQLQSKVEFYEGKGSSGLFSPPPPPSCR